MTDAGPPLLIVYVAGAQNCGSTLLDAVLGAAPGARSLGEVGGFHRYRPGAACACGEPSAACSPCGAAMTALAEAGASATYEQVSKAPLKERRFHWALLGSRGRRRYAEIADVVFDGVAGNTGATTLIDSSKNAAAAAALVHDSRHNVRIIHLVRDGRGYLRSRRTRAKADGRRYLPPVVLASWLAKNLLIGSVLRWRVPADRYLRCRYEDLVARPAETLEAIGRFAGIDASGLSPAATGEGVQRLQLFEPARRTDYRLVRLDSSRLASQRWSPRANLAYWLGGGFVSALWGYDRRQSYLDQG